jgi:hypothetical protein
MVGFSSMSHVPDAIMEQWWYPINGSSSECGGSCGHRNAEFCRHQVSAEKSAYFSIATNTRLPRIGRLMRLPATKPIRNRLFLRLEEPMRYAFKLAYFISSGSHLVIFSMLRTETTL